MQKYTVVHKKDSYIIIHRNIQNLIIVKLMIVKCIRQSKTTKNNCLEHILLHQNIFISFQIPDDEVDFKKYYK